MSPPDPMDGDLAAMLAGDDTAFRSVYRAVHPPLLRYLTVLVGASNAEDVASEAWAQAFRDLMQFTGGADAFRAWLTTIGRHRALDHLRRQSRRIQPTSELDAVAELADGTDLVAEVLERESTNGALALLRELPREQAEAVVLRAVLGFDAETAGQILGKRAGAVRSAAHRGLRTLAARLEDAERPRRRGGLDRLVRARDISAVHGAEEVR